MLARVTAALIKFIHPLSASVSGATASESGKNAEFQRFKSKSFSSKTTENPEPTTLLSNEHQGSQKDQKPKLKLVPSPPQSTSKSAESSSDSTIRDSTEGFLKIFSSVQVQGNQRVRSLAIHTYKMAIRGQKKKRTRKGSILDRNVD